MDITLDGTYGNYDDKGNTSKGSTANTVNSFGDYYSVSVSKSFDKFDVSLAYTGMEFDVNTNGHDGDGDEDNLVVTISTSF